LDHLATAAKVRYLARARSGTGLAGFDDAGAAFYYSCAGGGELFANRSASFRSSPFRIRSTAWGGLPLSGSTDIRIAPSIEEDCSDEMSRGSSLADGGPQGAAGRSDW